MPDHPSAVPIGSPPLFPGLTVEHADPTNADDPSADIKPLDAPLRIALWIAAATPILIVLLLVVDPTYGAASNFVAKAGSGALVLALVLVAAKRLNWLAAGLLVIFLASVIFVVAAPGGRHPLVMACALLPCCAVSLSLVANHVSDPSHRRRWVAGVVLLFGAWLMGTSSAPFRLRVAVSESVMDERAREAMKAPGQEERNPFDRTKIGEPLPPYECPYVGGPYLGPLGPYPYCFRYTNEDGEYVSYGLGNAPFALDDHEDAGLIYSPSGPPRLSYRKCLAHVTGAWYEYSSWSGAGMCPVGLE